MYDVHCTVQSGESRVDKLYMAKYINRTKERSDQRRFFKILLHNLSLSGYKQNSPKAQDSSHARKEVCQLKGGEESCDIERERRKRRPAPQEIHCFFRPGLSSPGPTQSQGQELSSRIWLLLPHHPIPSVLAKYETVQIGKHQILNWFPRSKHEAVSLKSLTTFQICRLTPCPAWWVSLTLDTNKTWIINAAWRWNHPN